MRTALGEQVKAGVADLRADRDRARSIAVTLEAENENLLRLLYDAWFVISEATGPDEQWRHSARRWRAAWRAATMHPAAADQQADAGTVT